MDDLTGLLLWGGSRLTCIIKTNSPCLSSHNEDVYTFWFQQTTFLTATLLFQPHLINTVQLQMIIYKSVCCFTHMHTDIISYTTYSWDARNLQISDFRCAHNNKRQYSSPDKKCALQTPSCLTMVSVQSGRFIALNHSCRRFFIWQWQQECDQISNLRLHYIDSGTQHHQDDILNSLCIRVQFSLCLTASAAVM